MPTPDSWRHDQFQRSDVLGDPVNQHKQEQHEDHDYHDLEEGWHEVIYHQCHVLRRRGCRHWRNAVGDRKGHGEGRCRDNQDRSEDGKELVLVQEVHPLIQCVNRRRFDCMILCIGAESLRT